MEAWGRGRCIFSFIPFSVQLSLQYGIVAALLSGCHHCCWCWNSSGLLEALPQLQGAAVQGISKGGGVVQAQHVNTGVGSSCKGQEASASSANFMCLIPCGAKGDFSHKRAHSFTLCSSFQYENYCKTWQQLIELKILFLSQSKFLFQNQLWNRGWNRSQTTWKWVWRIYCLSSKDLCRTHNLGSRSWKC